MSLANVVCVSLGAALGVAACALWDKCFNKTSNEKKLDHKCLFFTPKQVSCTSKCKVVREQYFDFPCNNCSLNALCAELAKAKKELKICMYLITADDLCNTVIDVFCQGVNVKIITDKFVCEDATGAGNKVNKFKKAEIPMKIIKCSYMMHNKFAIVDNETLIIGSINWTRQGFSGNYENVLILRHEEIVQKYNDHFSLLWCMKS